MTCTPIYEKGGEENTRVHTTQIHIRTHSHKHIKMQSYLTQDQKETVKSYVIVCSFDSITTEFNQSKVC